MKMIDLKSLILLSAGFLSFAYITTSCNRTKDPVLREQPNIVIILVDDMGFSDPGCYGGEIQTPNLDYLAGNGLRFTDFHNTARCSPTRAALLTGTYQHQAGMANIGHSLKSNVVTLAEVLKEGGYQTAMTGKWHLSLTDGLENKEETNRWVGHLSDHGDFSPLNTYPCNRGFDEHYGVIWGVVNHYDPFSLVHNEEPIKNVPKAFHLTDFISDKSVDLIEMFDKKENPFFLYVAYSAPHFPLHAKEKDIEKYKNLYADGWDSLRVRRYRNMLNLGLFDAATTPLAPQDLNNGKSLLTPLTENLNWDGYKYKEWESKHMEVHAAMVDQIDQGIEKIISKLKDLGKLDNTLIMFLSDNGASPERRGKKPGHHRTKYLRNGEEVNWITDENDTISPGSENTYSFLGRGWAGAVNAPFRYWKAESYEGGTCTPFIVHWPAGLKAAPGSITNQFGHVMDIMPTLLEITQIEYPKEYKGNKIIPYSGKSLLPIFNGEIREPHDTIFWEHNGGKAVRAGDWKISALKNEDWELFNLKKDRTEINDLSKTFPEKVQKMEQAWNAWYVRVNK